MSTFSWFSLRMAMLLFCTIIPRKLCSHNDALAEPVLNYHSCSLSSCSFIPRALVVKHLLMCWQWPGLFSCCSSDMSALPLSGSPYHSLPLPASVTHVCPRLALLPHTTTCSRVTPQKGLPWLAPLPWHTRLQVTVSPSAGSSWLARTGLH